MWFRFSGPLCFPRRGSATHTAHPDARDHHTRILSAGVRTCLVVHPDLPRSPRHGRHCNTVWWLHAPATLVCAPAPRCAPGGAPQPAPLPTGGTATQCGLMHTQPLYTHARGPRCAPGGAPQSAPLCGGLLPGERQGGARRGAGGECRHVQVGAAGWPGGRWEATGRCWAAGDCTHDRRCGWQPQGKARG